METINELYWTLDEILKNAKKNLIKIHYDYDYDTRFRIWSEQILRDRLNTIIQTNGNSEYVQHVINLTFEDYGQLGEQIRNEFIINKNLDQYRKRNFELFTITKKILELYENKIGEKMKCPKCGNELIKNGNLWYCQKCIIYPNIYGDYND